MTNNNQPPVIELLTPLWEDYELIDTGNFEKLERFGDMILSRPEPQAIWKKSLPQKEWDRLCHAVFHREKGRNNKQEGEKGNWILLKKMIPNWWIRYRYEEMELKFRLGLTAFKHVGVFPEQAQNWNFIFNRLKTMPPGTRVLNLFAYTGGASLAARAAGAGVTHVDSVRQVINRSAENMEASGLTGIRWIIDDVLKFMRREQKRGKTYQGIIMDPPAYGRGPDGEKWILEDGINELMEICSNILRPENSFLVINLYSMGFSALIAANLMRSYFPSMNIHSGELYIADKSLNNLPLGVFARGYC